MPLQGGIHRWAGKVALVTGASSGIGAAVVKDLATEGIHVVGVARRDNKIKELAQELKGAKGSIYAVKADLTKEDDIVKAFRWAEKTVGPVSLLINNAGVSILGDTMEGKMDEWRQQFDVNVYAAGICIREYLKTLKARNINEGHIVNVCSIVGQKVLDFPGFYVYTATKHAMNVITEGVRQELLKKKSMIKLTTISPGLVGTELFDTAGQYSQERADTLSELARLESPDISNAIIYAISLPQNVRVSEMVLQATGEFF